MKKIPYVLFISIFISFFCFTQLSSVKAEEVKTFVGKVESYTLTLGLPPRVDSSKITVVDDNGNKSTFFICRATTVTDINGNKMWRRTYGKGKKVKIKYFQDNGKNEAISIHFVPLNYVQQATTVSTPEKSVSETTVQPDNTFTGTIKKSTPLLGLKGYDGVYNELKVAADDGEIITIYVMRKTVITDKAGNDISEQRGQNNRRVQIKYSTLGCSKNIAIFRNIATSIHYLD